MASGKRLHTTRRDGLNQNFLLVAKMSIVKWLLTIASCLRWNLHQLDVNNAFLHGDLFWTWIFLLHIKSNKSTSIAHLFVRYINQFVDSSKLLNNGIKIIHISHQRKFHSIQKWLLSILQINECQLHGYPCLCWWHHYHWSKLTTNWLSKIIIKL